MNMKNELLKSAIEFAKEAGQLIRDNLNQSNSIKQKLNHADLVTEVDQLSEALLRERIKTIYPDHWILSEEANGQANPFEIIKQKKSGIGWVIDPIDGTTNFIHRIPHFAVSIGIVQEGVLIIGVVYNPVTNDLYYAINGEGAFCNEIPIQVSHETEIDEAVIATGYPSKEWKENSTVVKQIDALTGKCRSIRLLGASSLDLCFVAKGLLSGFWHDELNPWDTAAGLLILREAGGKADTRDGQEFHLEDRSLVASNGFIHDSFLKLLK
jgi:myo-inositol-1(or 4)-monophosphatase